MQRVPMTMPVPICQMKPPAGSFIGREEEIVHDIPVRIMDPCLARICLIVPAFRRRTPGVDLAFSTSARRVWGLFTLVCYTQNICGCRWDVSTDVL
jgi:hypothetical protein